MLPLYKRTMRFVSDPYLRMKKKSLIGVIAALFSLYLIILLISPSSEPPPPFGQGPPGFQQPDKNAPVVAQLSPTDPKQSVGGLRKDANHDEADNTDRNVVEGGRKDEPKIQPPPEVHHTPFIIRMFLPLVAGYCFGFLGSVPVAGPTSAMVLKLGIQGKYEAAFMISFGGALSEATYAGIAFWGFGSFLAGAKFLLPLSKVLGAVMFTIVGLIFLRSDVKPTLDANADAVHRKEKRPPARDEMVKNILVGLTMSGINPSLLATYTGAIASVYGTGMLEFTLFLAFVFAIGVCCGILSWFFLLLSLLKKYKQRLKTQTIGYIMRGMGCFLLTLGMFCAKSSYEYFTFQPSTTGKAPTQP